MGTKRGSDGNLCPENMQKKICRSDDCEHHNRKRKAVDDPHPTSRQKTSHTLVDLWGDNQFIPCPICNKADSLFNINKYGKCYICYSDTEELQKCNKCGALDNALHVNYYGQCSWCFMAFYFRS
jgi:hypothetical protein